MIRGFLNDGGINYKDHHHVDSLAFGHCEYSYRNLGRPSAIKIRHYPDNFVVEVDGRTCFESPKIALPSGYNLGVSAASSQDPDSFEVFKLVVMTKTYSAPPQVNDHQQIRQPPAKQPPTSQAEHPFPDVVYPDDPKYESADKIEQAQQFSDIHDRLQSNFRHISIFQRDFNQYAGRADGQHGILSAKVDALSARLDTIEKSLEAIGKTLANKDYLRLHNELKHAVEQSHGHLADSLSENVGTLVHAAAPRLGKFIFIVLGFQGLLAVSYVLYKRKRANAPKKYL